MTDEAKRGSADLTKAGMQEGDGFRIEKTWRGAWTEKGLPKNFVGHPVADAGEKLLHEEEGLEGGAGAPGTNLSQIGCGEFGREDGWGELGPPSGGTRGDGKANAAKEAGIAKNERVTGCAQNEMVVGARPMERGGGEEAAGHAEMEAEPSIGAEAKKHLLPVSVRGAQGATANFPGEKSGGGPTKNAFVGLQVNGGNFLAYARIPFLTKVFHFSEFGHGERTWREVSGKQVVV